MSIVYTTYNYHECIVLVYTCNMRMCISELQMAFHSRIGVEDLLELLPLENSTSPVWKFIGFPGHDGKIIESYKKLKAFFVNCVMRLRIRMLEIQQIYSDIWRKAISKNIIKLKARSH